MLNKAIFFDRDGTLIKEKHHLVDPTQIEILPGAVEALKRAKEAGYHLILITNQSVVGRGLITEADLDNIHSVLQAELLHANIRLDGIFACPHHPSEAIGEYLEECTCRKPQPGLLLQAASTLGIDLARSFMIGDTAGDVEAGRRAGCKAILVRTGYGAAEARRRKALSSGDRSPDYIANDVLDAVKWCLWNSD